MTNDLVPSDGQNATRRSSNRTWLWFLIGLLVLVFGLSIGPRVPDDQQVARCVVNVHLPGPFGVSLNCDSPEFLRLAAMPSDLFAQKNTRQSRPGLIVAAAVLSRPIAPLLNIPKLFKIRATRADIDPSRISGALATQFPAYVAYIMLNFLILCAAFYCVGFIDREAFGNLDHQAQIILASLGILIVASDVTKAYFWTPHTQMFNVLIPIFATFVFVCALNGGFHDRYFSVASGLITGLGLTAYPTFVIVIPCAVFATLVAFLRSDIVLKPRRLAVNFALFLLLAAAPLSLWYAYVRLETGAFYSEEIAHGPSLWIPAVYAQDGVRGLFEFFVHHSAAMLSLAANQAISLAVLAAIIFLLGFRSGAAVVAALRRNVPLLFSALIVDVGIGSFYSLSGDMHFRWAYALIPPLLIALGAIILAIYRDLDFAARRAVTAACMTLAIWQIGFTIVKDGPFS